jgi:hypothetical protein
MKLPYLILKIILGYAIRLFYPRRTYINKQKDILGTTIYVSNHAASFMDPLIFSVLEKPSVYFMTRADVFTKKTHKIFDSFQMLPIYRQHDGVETISKNNETFERATKVLSKGRNLLIFGEGFTDDVFIRRLKPVKKGAVRIGFSALETFEWKKKVYIAAMGINYGDPNRFGSEVIISHGDKICLNDFELAYKENPNKVITELTNRIEIEMQANITHVENEQWVFFHEHIMRLKRNGLHVSDTDFSIPAKTRLSNSKQVANWLNTQNSIENEEVSLLKTDLEYYFELQEKLKIDESCLYRVHIQKRGIGAEIAFLILTFPLMIVGLFHFYFPYRFVKNFAEKKFKRSVFWGSVKMVMGMFILGIFNIPLAWAVSQFFPSCFPPFSGLIYFLILPFFGVIAYQFFEKMNTLKSIKRVKKTNCDSLLELRMDLISRINKMGI